MIKKIYFLLTALVSLTFSLQAMSSDEFVRWWSSYRTQENIPEDLRDMEDYYISSGLYNHASKFWTVLNKKNIEQITQYGYENFKQTVTCNYFTWVVSIDHPYARNLKAFAPEMKITLPQSELNKIHPLWGAKESESYNNITAHFINYFEVSGRADLLDKLEEPLYGNPPSITYRGKRVSQDILNSLLEYQPISQHIDLDETTTIIEVGAGSGRTAYCFMSLLPQAKYVIVDLPPALYVSQQYLSDVLPEKKVMKFRPFNKFSEIEEEFAGSDLIFLTPDQITKLPSKSADLFLAIDCLHEMREPEINFYFEEANRLCSSIYFKCWQYTKVPYDGMVYTQKSYPVKSNWKALFSEPCVVPSDFFHAMYSIE